MKAAIGLGCSLGDRIGHLELAVRSLHHTPGMRVLRVSPLYRTPPMRGGTARGWFLNGVALVQTELSPHQVLARCRELEERAGRRRGRYWGDRPLDLDLLLYGDQQVNDEVLTVPHPGINQRPFVHQPLLAIWPDVRDPRDGSRLADQPRVATPRPVPVAALAWPRAGV